MKTFKLTMLSIILVFGIITHLEATTISPNNPKIQYFGRWDFTIPTQPVTGWGSGYIRIKFTGTGVTIKLTDASNVFQYSIDGGAMTVLSAGLGASTVLASELSNGTHTLGFYRRSGGSHGRTTFNGFEITNGDLVNPDPPKCLNFEFVGNSISVGFKNECSLGSACDGANPATENGYMSWGPQLARLFDGDWRVEAHSGQGMFMNLYNFAGPTMADEFEYKNFPVWTGGDQQDKWLFADGFQPDVFVCALGTNDFASLSSYPTRTQFNGRYNTFLNLVRSKYPDATIVLFGILLNTWGGYSKQVDEGNDNIQALVDSRMTAGDNNIFFINPRPDKTDANMWLPNESDYIGDWTHPSIAGDGIIASKIKAFMDGNSFIKNRLDLKVNACNTNTSINNTNESNNQNINIYPTPASKEINIKYTLNEPSNVIIQVYDITGKIIQQLTVANSIIGDNEISWNGKNASGDEVTNGLYFLKITTKNYTHTAIGVIQK